MKSRAEQLMEWRASNPPRITTSKGLSDYRKFALEQDIENGRYQETAFGNQHRMGDQNFQFSNYILPSKLSDFAGDGPSIAGAITYSSNRKRIKNAAGGDAGAFTTDQSTSLNGANSGWRGMTGTTRQIPEVYSPLWLNSNLNLPRDRATINAWCRTFFALNPIVQNAITLHSTYPIAKLNIKCKDPQKEKFYAQMAEELQLMNVCSQIAQEFWTLGECFVFAEYDERTAKWSRLLIQNPDYITVQRSTLAGEPIISLRPDENLRRMVTSNRPADIQQRRQLSKEIVDHVRKGENIPLNNFNISHLARRISPYEIRGTGLIVNSFRQLMLFDKLRECYSTDCEVLTRDGFKKITDLLEISDDVNPNPEYVNGIELDEDGNVSGVLKLKDGVEVACFNPDTEEMEYHVPEELHMSQYKGKMLHFNGDKVDCLVTPNHKMWTKKKNKNWDKIPASQMFDTKGWWKFRSHLKWTGKKVDNINVLDTNVPTNLYLEMLGYLISEGNIYKNNKPGIYDAKISLSQLTSDGKHEPLRNAMHAFADIIRKKCSDNISVKGSGYSKDTPKEKWEGVIHGKDLANYLINEIGNGETAKSHDKKIPRWVLELCPEQLNILLNSLVMGDGSKSISKYGTGSESMRYSTVSKQLADDVYEIAYKCGFVPNICVSTAKKIDGRVVTEYIVLWSTTQYSNEPNIYTGTKQCVNGGGVSVEEVDYEGPVWCFTVPTGLFVTRRNGKVTIQGNSKFAQADNMINPLTLVKIGDVGKGFFPNPSDLQQWREIFECHDEETEVLTGEGFKKLEDVISYEEKMNGTFGTSHISNVSAKRGVKIACFNPETENLEYHEPSEAHVYNYHGEMIHFKNDKMDIKVTPNHDMWVRLENKWKKIKAEKLFNVKLAKTMSGLEGEPFNIIDVPTAEKVHYDGKVWCFTVPTGLFITRRNGKITIQGNSAQYDKDFKVFTHDGVSVERIGYAQGIYDISNDVQQLIKEIYIGLMVPSVVMDGSDTTYATGSVALDVLRQRYMQFRNMLSHFLKEKIFAPIAKLNDFYEYVDGVKTLIIPEIDWNHMSLFDMSDYIQNISNLAQGEGLAKKVSLQTLYRSLGLEYDDEMRKIRYEDIQDTIRSKELVALQQYPLNELRALGRDDEIDEVQEAPVPGENPYDEPGGDMGGGMGGGMGVMPGGVGGSPLGLPPPPGGAPPAPIGGGGGRPPGTGSGPAGVPGPPGGGTGIGPGNIPKPPSPT